MNLQKVAHLSKKISVRNFNKNTKYHCDNYTLSHGNGKWRLFLNGVFVMNEDYPKFFEIVDTFQWYRQLTPELYQLVELPDNPEEEERRFFERPLEEVLNEYRTPSTKV